MVDLRISFNGVDFSPSRLTFSYSLPPRAAGTTPFAEQALQNYPIQIYGELCGFRGAEMSHWTLPTLSGDILIREEILCSVPSSTPAFEVQRIEIRALELESEVQEIVPQAERWSGNPAHLNVGNWPLRKVQVIKPMSPPKRTKARSCASLLKCTTSNSRSISLRRLSC